MDLFLSFVNGLGIMALATGSYSYVQRRKWPRYVRHLLIGGLFGLGATLTMLNTAPIAPGVIVDSRNLFVAFTAIFVGPVGAAASLVVACGSRLLVGGSGAVLGILSMGLAAAIGLVWHLYGRKVTGPAWARFSAMGLTISLSLATVLFLPVEHRDAALGATIPILVAFNVLGALVFGAMIERERHLTRRERTLTRETLTDPLTGALNRRGLAARYAEEMAHMRHRGGALLVLDLDHFKEVNDAYGHAVGDEVLKCAVTAADQACRFDDTVGRLGGEEFAVLLPVVSPSQALKIAERVRASIEGIVIPECPELRVTTSIGLVHFEGRVPELSEALRATDKALYMAKRSGRNRTVTGVLPAHRTGPRAGGRARPPFASEELGAA